MSGYSGVVVAFAVAVVFVVHFIMVDVSCIAAFVDLVTSLLLRLLFSSLLLSIVFVVVIVDAVINDQSLLYESSQR